MDPATAESQDVTAATSTWLARDSGLILRPEEDLAPGGAGGKQHLSMRYDYANVRAPAGAK